MKYIEYKGQEPKVIPSPNVDKVLEIMAKQLEILKALSMPTLIVHEETKVQVEDR